MTSTTSQIRKHLFFLKQIRSVKNLFGKIDFILIFFLALFLVTCISLFMFKTTATEYGHTADIAQLEVFNFTLNRFDTHWVNTIIKADSAKQYNDREVYYNFFANRIGDNGVRESLVGKEVWHIANIYDFVQGINYTKSPDVSFFSEKGMYNQETEVFVGQGNFFIEDVNLETTGQDIFYDKNKDTIKAKNIHTKIRNY